MSKNTNLSFLTDYITADITNGRIGINTPSPTVAFDVTGVAKFSSSVTATSFNATTTNIFSVDGTERMRITSAGNVGIGTSSPSNKLQVSGNIYADGGITSTGTVAGNILSVNSAVYTYNVQQAYYGQNFVFTPPNALNSGSDNSLMRMYMVWVWGANGATEAGCRVWMIAMNGGGTAHTVSQLLGRDANGVTSLSIARTSASEITISSNNNAFIKYVSIMQLMTYANG